MSLMRHDCHHRQLTIDRNSEFVDYMSALSIKLTNGQIATERAPGQVMLKEPNLVIGLPALVHVQVNMLEKILFRY